MTNKKIFTAEAYISKVTTMHDKTLRLVVDTQELNAQEKSILFDAAEKPGWFLFSEQEIQESDIKDLPDIQIEKNEKHPSQRLRAVLYRLWEQSDKQKYPEFEVFYRAKMDRLIEGYKEKLN